jgi:biotin-independent malonate decarboxylase gamma subunit
MTLDEILNSLFPSGHDVKTSAAGIINGTGKRKDGEGIAVIGVANGEALGTAGVLPLAEEVLRVVAKGGKTPILVLVDTQGRLMARREEMRGLNEYLAHLAKCQGRKVNVIAQAGEQFQRVLDLRRKTRNSFSTLRRSWWSKASSLEAPMRSR